MTRKLLLAAIAALSITAIAAPVSASPLAPANKACFFKGVGFTGASFCVGTGQRKFMPAEFAGSVSSIQIIGKVSASLCTGRVRPGTCKTFTKDTWQVPSPLYNAAKSYQVQLDRSAEKVIQKTVPVSTISLTTGRKVDLDGLGRRFVVAPDPSLTDIVHARTNSGGMLQAINGAKLSWNFGTKRTKSQCKNARYTTGIVPTNTEMLGKYVCVKTNAGNYGQMRITSATIGETKVKYTHWPQ